MCRDGHISKLTFVFLNSPYCTFSIYIFAYMGQFLQDMNFGHFMSLFFNVEVHCSQTRRASPVFSTVLSRFFIVATINHFNSSELFHYN